jgi:hypothetical protein
VVLTVTDNDGIDQKRQEGKLILPGVLLQQRRGVVSLREDEACRGEDEQGSANHRESLGSSVDLGSEETVRSRLVS